MRRLHLIRRAAPFLGVTWAALGAFFLWDAQQSGEPLGYLLGISAVALGIANLTIFLRR